MGWVCAAVLGRAAAQSIEFPLGEYSFEKIAQRLSVGGRRVVCAPALRQRLALVHLKPRSWQQARALLEHALDLRFRPIGANRWVLERDPAVAQREQRLLARLADMLDAQVRVQTRLLRACLDPNAPADRVAWQIVQLQSPHLPRETQQAHQARLRRQIAHAQSMPLATALANWRTYERFSNAFTQWRERNRVLEFLQKYPLASFGFSEEERRWAAREAQQWHEQWASELHYVSLRTDDPREAQAHLLCYLGQVAQAWLPVWSLEVIFAQARPAIRTEAVLRRGQSIRAQTFRLPPAIAAWLQEDPYGYEIPLFQVEEVPMRLQVRASWRIDGGYVYTLEVDSPRLRWARASVVPRVEVRLRWTPADALAYFQALDRAWAHAYQTAYAQHLKQLQDPIVQAPLPEASQTPMDTLALWAKTYHQEIIVEVYEPLQTLQIFGNSPSENTLARVLNRLLEPCLLERSGSAWILRHWAAFVRRVPDLPAKGAGGRSRSVRPSRHSLPSGIGQARGGTCGVRRYPHAWDVKANRTLARSRMKRKPHHSMQQPQRQQREQQQGEARVLDAHAAPPEQREQAIDCDRQCPRNNHKPHRVRSPRQPELPVQNRAYAGGQAARGAGASREIVDRARRQPQLLVRAVPRRVRRQVQPDPDHHQHTKQQQRVAPARPARHERKLYPTGFCKHLARFSHLCPPP